MELSLRPYHGSILLCDSPAEMRKQYRRLCRKTCPHEITESGGRYIKIEFDHPHETQWLVYSDSLAYLAHEFCHVLLQTFKTIGHDPTQGDGEPFCYMLSQLMLEASPAPTHEG
jgi:hypothetical protein